ncbi:MAG: TMEM175 family protein [Actinomycetota bacterium]
MRGNLRKDSESDLAETGRLETFADGVMAIAITLLILEIDVPHAGPGRSLGEALGELWPSYAAYFVSFMTIGIIWVNHHHLFTVIQRTNHTFLVLNVLFLMTIAFLPWPTALVAEHIRQHDARTLATVVYGLSMFSIAVMFNVAWRYAARGLRLLPSNINRNELERVNRSYLSGPITYLVATVLAFANAWWSLGIFAALALYWLLPGSGPRIGRLLEEPVPESETAASRRPVFVRNTSIGWRSRSSRNRLSFRWCCLVPISE